MLFMSLGWAQEAKKEEKANLVFGKTMELEMEMVSVPDSVGSGGKPAPAIEDQKASQEGRWLRIDVPFSTTNKFTPEVKFKFSLEGYEGAEGLPMGKFVVLSGEATYRDVPAGKKHFAGVFLPPASVLRFSAQTGGAMDWAKGLMNLRVEATEGGAPVEKVFDLQSEKEVTLSKRGGKKDFITTGVDWNKSPDAQEVSGALLPIYETPFWPKDYKRYSQPKKP